MTKGTTAQMHGTTQRKSSGLHANWCRLTKNPPGQAQKNISGRPRNPENSPSCIPHHTGSRTGSSLPLELWLRFWIPPWSFSRLFCGSAKLECAHPENAAETPSIRHFVPRESRRKPCKGLHPCVQPGKSRRESQECPERRVVFRVLGWGCGGNDFTVFFALFAMPCSSQRNAHDVSLGFRVFCFSSCAASFHVHRLVPSAFVLLCV